MEAMNAAAFYPPFVWREPPSVSRRKKNAQNKE
jgi:hypothetical protein